MLSVCDRGLNVHSQCTVLSVCDRGDKHSYTETHRGHSQCTHTHSVCDRGLRVSVSVCDRGLRVSMYSVECL